MTAYYNENDPYCAQWLRNLIAAGHIAAGDVDERSIEDVRPVEIISYTQCHFFAGIGIWSHSLRVAGWPDDHHAYTGSCPCQPFSAAGKGGGFADERHLWPAWFHLISECRPVVVFGEQVSSKNGHAWLDLVQTDLEELDYACGAVVTPAAGFGAPHERHRVYWMAHSNDTEWRPAKPKRDKHHRQATRWQKSASDTWERLHGPYWREIASGVCPQTYGSPIRMGRLRAYGNAIVAPQATEFIKVAMEMAP